MTDQDRIRPYDDHATVAERSARRRRRLSEVQALADAPPGIPGTCGTTVGGQPGAPGSAHPPSPSRRGTASHRDSADPSGADEGR
ncbi:hypothetical protein ACIHEJ_31115 [Streptomyces sp. NPDC052301]|uniref:hypothetical protein n=1 Tax=Streptomyces sp. NPDC052301 TaxID=3365687 RepID=UPI0037CDDAC7